MHFLYSQENLTVTIHYNLSIPSYDIQNRMAEFSDSNINSPFYQYIFFTYLHVLFYFFTTIRTIPLTLFFKDFRPNVEQFHFREYNL